jgi:hypothetical protein
MITATVLVLALAAVTLAQQCPGFSELNRESYRLYEAGQWDSVILVGRQALGQGIDFYYLRMRMGIACYELHHYRKAAAHFDQALEFNQEDPVALEYLYFARLFAGQDALADHVRKQFRGDLAKKLPREKAEFADRAGAEFLYSKGLNSEILDDPGLSFPAGQAGAQYLATHFINASVWLSSRFAPGVSLNQAFTFLAKNNYMYYTDGLIALNVPEQRVRQTQYCITPSFTTASGFTAAPVFHLLYIRYQVPVASGMQYQGGSGGFSLQYRDEWDYVTGLTLRQGLGRVDLQLGGWYATLNNREQVQGRLGLTWFPLGNLDLYAGAYLNGQWETAGPATVSRFIPELHLGFALFRKLWLDVNGTAGKMSDYLEQNGSVVFNSFSEVIRSKLNFTATLPVTEKGSLVYVGARWTTHESRFEPFDTSLETGNPISYHAISIYGGISWK